MTTFNGITPSSQTQTNYTYRTNNYQLGDGYKDVSPDGINDQVITSQIMWNVLNAAQLAQLQAWIATVPPYVSWAGDGVLLPTSRQFRILEDGIQITNLEASAVQVQINIEQFN